MFVFQDGHRFTARQEFFVLCRINIPKQWLKPLSKRNQATKVLSLVETGQDFRGFCFLSAEPGRQAAAMVVIAPSPIPMRVCHFTMAGKTAPSGDIPERASSLAQAAAARITGTQEPMKVAARSPRRVVQRRDIAWYSSLLKEQLQPYSECLLPG